VQGLVEGIFYGMLDAKANPGPAIAWMAEGYGMSADEVQGMLADAHSTNFAENAEFFLNANNPTNFERTWGAISYVYRELGLIDAPVRFDQVMDFSYLKKIKDAGTFKDQKDEYTQTFVPQSYTKVTAEAPLLTQELRINFFPNSANLHEEARDEVGGIKKGTLYDPLVDTTVERAARLAGQFDRAVIAVSGHTDASMKGKVPLAAVQDLSRQRAEAVREELIKKYKFDRNKFVVTGEAWNRPADPNDPDNHFKNRRVEIAVYPPEGE
jgi:outer membrane protein OmpA-like peptidoglycan-associated protein